MTVQSKFIFRILPIVFLLYIIGTPPTRAKFRPHIITASFQHKLASCYISEAKIYSMSHLFGPCMHVTYIEPKICRAISCALDPPIHIYLMFIVLLKPPKLIEHIKCMNWDKTRFVTEYCITNCKCCAIPGKMFCTHCLTN